jgi:hypothetical protein
MNTPGVAAGNWSWRYKADELTDTIADELKTLSILFGRHEEPVVEEIMTDSIDVTENETVSPEKEVIADA